MTRRCLVPLSDPRCVAWASADGSDQLDTRRPSRRWRVNSEGEAPAHAGPQHRSVDQWKSDTAGGSKRPHQEEQECSSTGTILRHLYLRNGFVVSRILPEGLRLRPPLSDPDAWLRRVAGKRQVHPGRSEANFENATASVTSMVCGSRSQSFSGDCGRLTGPWVCLGLDVGPTVARFTFVVAHLIDGPISSTSSFNDGPLLTVAVLVGALRAQHACAALQRLGGVLGWLTPAGAPVNPRPFMAEWRMLARWAAPDLPT